MASESERTVIGNSIGTLPLRGWVGPKTFFFCFLMRTRGSSSVSRPTRPPRMSFSALDLRSAWRRLRWLWRASLPTTRPGPPGPRLAPPFFLSPPSSSSAISSGAPGTPGGRGTAGCCCWLMVRWISSKVRAGPSRLSISGGMSAILRAPPEGGGGSLAFSGGLGALGGGGMATRYPPGMEAGRPAPGMRLRSRSVGRRAPWSPGRGALDPRLRMGPPGRACGRLGGRTGGGAAGGATGGSAGLAAAGCTGGAEGFSGARGGASGALAVTVGTDCDG